MVLALTLRPALVYFPESCGRIPTSKGLQMDANILGPACALLAALTWAFAMILFKKSGEKVPPLALNLFKNVVAIVLLVVTLLGTWLVTGEGLEEVRAFTAYDVGILLLSGFIGIAVADTLFFYSLNLIGVGIISIVDCLYGPMVFLFSALLLSESLNPLQYAGGGMILAAVLITARHEPPEGRTRLQLLIGIALGVLDMVFLAFGIVIAKRVLEGFPIVWASLIRLAGGTAALAVIVAFLPQRRALVSVFKPSGSWKFILPASFLGAYLSLLFWIAGFKYTQASVAGILNQSASIFALILATLILKEAFTKRKFAAVVLALAGIVLVFWSA